VGGGCEHGKGDDDGENATDTPSNDECESGIGFFHFNVSFRASESNGLGDCKMQNSPVNWRKVFWGDVVTEG